MILWLGVRNYPGVLFDANAHGRAQGADANAQRSEEERKTETTSFLRVFFPMATATYIGNENLF